MAELVIPLELRGANAEAYYCRDPEILDEGPAGTGKTLMWLNLLNNLCHKYPGFHGLIARKAAITLTTTCLVTFNTEVLKPEDGVTFFGGNRSEPAAYRYPNGSTIVTGGFEKGIDGGPSKILSTQYHLAFVNEAIELTLDDLETLKTRVRPHGEPLIANDGSGDVFAAYRVVMDCNPSTERHWLLKRCNEGRTRRFKSTLRDNPLYFDAAGNATAAGKKYSESLEGLSGTRYQRLVEGQWVGMENAIYDLLDRDKHWIASPEGQTWGQAAIGVDYGTVNLSAVVCVQKDTAGRIWARECWTGGGDEQPILDAVRSMKQRYGAIVGVVDPIPAMQMLADKLGFRRSGTAIKASGEGSRVANVVRVKTLLANDALRFDQGGEGVAELFEEALDYRWLHKDSENIEKYIVDRHNEDRVAAMEYAIEALETRFDAAGFMAGLRAQPIRYKAALRARDGAVRVFGGRA